MDKNVSKGQASPALKVTAGVKAGGFNLQHNRRTVTLKVRARVKAGGFTQQHNCRLARA